MSMNATAQNMLPEAPPRRLDDLAQIICSYNQVTENLQHSHEALQSQVVRLQEQLASTDAQLQRSRRLAALGEMAAGIAHEIRNPLAAIQLYADMVIADLGAFAHEDLPATACENAGKIASAVRRLDAIVSDVLTFAREISPRPRSVTVGELFGRAVEAHHQAGDCAAIEVRRPGDEMLQVEVDSDLLQQVLLNLMRNATEAMDDGGILTLQARQDDGHLVLVVRDTGCGIGKQDIDRIFNPFFTTRNTGTGLGLAIVHRIIDAHRGAIRVYNDGGAVFELSLPALPSWGGGS